MKEEALPKIKGSYAGNGNDPRGNASIDSIRTSGGNSQEKSGESALYQRRDDTQTDRDVLSDAADGDAANVREMEMLREYREKLRECTNASKRLEKQRQIALTATDRDERMKAANRANNAAQRVSKLDEQLTTMQNAKPLRELVERELKARDSLEKENAIIPYFIPFRSRP